MSQELLAIVEQLEREKGIKREVLIQAIESALLSATRKVVELKPNEELSVKLDPDTGEIRAFRDDKEITSIDFGRIAASTARQVIIQKLREAEKDVIYNEFQAKVGEIISGTVYRYEKGTIIIDLLGKAEGILLKREQSSREEFRQGQRIRAYVLEVKKDTKGPQILLSRGHQNFVKKLFELEVPEIYDGVVEIKAIARQAGERTKIAVCSKNDRVDSVGACVGMRGNRVRNIVTELQGEKIDIVRYHDDIREYIKAALSPAEVAEIKLAKEQMKAEVIVNDDQLSLAIGKHGQNVRLAGRLIGWELDIRTRQPAPEAAEALLAQTDAEGTQQEQAAAASDGSVLAQLSGVGEKTIENLVQSGFTTIEQVGNADIAQLTEVKGIGKKKAKKLIEEARIMLSRQG